MAAQEGAEIAKGDGRIPLRYFDAIVPFPEMAKPLWTEANTDRMAAKMQKQARF